MAGAVPITLRISGEEQRLVVDPRTTRLDCLRETVRLTGTKKGCDHGQRGACTVHVNGRPVNSCLSLALMHDSDEITTTEAWAHPTRRTRCRAGFVACDGYRSGCCTSGQIMSAAALLREPCGPDDADVKELTSGNICRCGAYSRTERISAGVPGRRVLGARGNLDIDCRYDAQDYKLDLDITNLGPVKCQVTIASAYDNDVISHRLNPGQTFRKRLSLKSSFGWYDHVIQVDTDPQFLRRLAGHVENGRDSASDPVIDCVARGR